MTRIRLEARRLGAGWSPTLEWYAVAVKAMQARPLADPTSWRFFAGMHGYLADRWQHFGVTTTDEPEPGPTVRARFWDQCQHQSWYFLPWHRGYLAAFEQVARKAISDAGGPDDWALPYWDYSAPIPDARTIPDAFEMMTLPDGSSNPLRVARRYGSGSFPVTIDEGSVSLRALRTTDFTSGANDTPVGFGGSRTSFHHGGGTNGGIESTPHNDVHGAIGGTAPGGDERRWQDSGLMGRPSTAALDPIFWLHHANTDRLWSRWRARNADPADESWLDGPVDRPFVMPDANGGEWSFTARQVLDTAAEPLGYAYQDELEIEGFEVAPYPGDRRGLRLAALRSAPQTSLVRPAPGGFEVDVEHGPELIGSSNESVSVDGDTNVTVRLDKPATRALRQKIQSAVESVAETVLEPPRVFLKLEGMTGTADSANFSVYIDAPPGADNAASAQRLAGTLSLFGISAASDLNGPTAGAGLSQVLEISEIVDALHVSGDELAAIDVRFVPAREGVIGAEFSIGQLNVYMLEQ